MPLRHLVNALIVVLLAACAANRDANRIEPISVNSPVTLGAGEGIAIVGISMRHPQIALLGRPWPLVGGLIAYDPKTNVRVGTSMLSIELGCAILRAAAACDGDTSYLAYKLPAGSYAFAWLDQTFKSYTPFVDFEYVTVTTQASSGAVVRREFSDIARLRPRTPVFTVRPGEVVYVGDLAFDFVTEGKVTIFLHGSEAAARKFIAGTGLSDQMVTRPFLFANGSAFPAGD